MSVRESASDIEPIIGIGGNGAVLVEGMAGGVAVSVDTEYAAVADDSDGVAAVAATTRIPTAARLYAFGTNYDRLRTADPTADGLSPTALGKLGIVPFLYGYSNALGTWNRLRADPIAAAAGPSILIARNRAHASINSIDPAANTGGTITLAAAGSGLRHFITHLRFVRVATAALAGAALLTITTTNLGGRQWRVGNAMVAGGTQIDMDIEFASPISSDVSNTNTTIVFPAPGAAVSWSAIVEYYTSGEAL